MPVVSPGKSWFLLILLTAYSVLCLVLVLVLPRLYLVPPMPPTDPALTAPPPDFSSITDISERKAAFFGYLQPMVEEHNRRVAKRREQVQQWAETLANKGELSVNSRKKLRQMAEDYRLNAEDMTAKAMVEALLLRVDQLPPSMVLAQAANESAWGTSRFAQDANNFFGQWCYTKGCGLVPSQRGEGQNHEVRKFRHPFASVGSYFRNINTHRAYRGIRQRRAALRAQDQPITGVVLIEGLRSYSERGAAYIKELREMIHYNGLDKLDPGAQPPQS